MLRGGPEVCDNGDMSRPRARRLLRASAAASIATFVALLSHVAGGGQMPAVLGVAVPWVLSIAVCTMLAGRTLSLWRLAAAVLISQLLFHALFVLGAAPSAVASSAIPTGHVHGLPAMESSALATPVTADLSMWMAHAAAAVVTVAALYRGERAVARLAAVAREMVAWVRRRALVVTTPLLAVPGLRFVSTPVVAGRVRHVAASLRRRGPPSFFVV